MAPNKPRQNVQSNAENAFGNLDKTIDSNRQKEKDRAKIKSTAKEITALLNNYIKNKPNVVKRIGLKKLIKVATDVTFKNLEKAGIKLNPNQKKAIRALLESYKYQTNKPGQGKGTTGKAPRNNKTSPSAGTPTRPRTRTDSFSGRLGSNEHKAYLARNYINGGKLNRLGQRFLRKMNPDFSKGLISLKRKVALQARRSIGVTTNFNIKITERDVLKALKA